LSDFLSFFDFFFFLGFFFFFGVTIPRASNWNLSV
jgi:hypothetical protein